LAVDRHDLADRFFGCEDDADELHRRQFNINAQYGIEMGDLDDMLMVERAGKENALMDFDRRTDWGRPEPLMSQLTHVVQEHGAQIVVLDTVADVFSGNEIVRNQVRRFITALRALAIKIQGVVILTAHPSNEGLNSGSGISGNRAWNNSVRSRLYLTKDGNKDEGDKYVRWLKTMKSNYSANGGKLKLEWRRGCFVPADAPRARDFSEAAEGW
ncbi:MAG: AAA family ATPase, partial [Pseudomonadota bacterium]